MWGELFGCFFNPFFLLLCFLWIIVLHLCKQGSSLSRPLPFTISTAGIYYLPPSVILWIILTWGSKWYHIFVTANILKKANIEYFYFLPFQLIKYWTMVSVEEKGDDQRDTAFHFAATLSFRLALAQRGANRYSNNKTNTKHCRGSKDPTFEMINNF